MPIIEIHDRTAWNALLLEQPSQTGIFLQSWEWGEFQKAVGRRVWRLGIRDQGSGVRFAQVIELLLPMGGKYWFIPRGAVIDGLAEEARKRGAWFIRFEPIIKKLQEVTGSYKMLQKVTSVHPKQTLIVDLSQSEEELLAGMHEKTRYNVRLALRKGVRVENVECRMQNVELFWELMQETAKRDKFRTHAREYYETMLRVLGNAPQPPSPAPTTVGAPSPTRGEGESLQFPSPLGRGEGEGMHVRLHLAYSGATPLAAAIVGYFGDTATYLHGASSYEHRALMGPYALHWSIMQDAKKQGYKFYDFWGIKTVVNSQKSVVRDWSGMTRFKLGFATVGSPDRNVGSGHIINYPGTFDLPLNKFWYTVYRLGRKML